MAVTRLELYSRVPYEDGVSFGAAGSYERIDGLLHFAVDPLHPLNEGIVDLDRAPRDDGGHVRFSADFCLLQPADPVRANRRLLFEVPNRGRRGALGAFNHATRPPVPSERIDPGDGFLLRHGWTVAWCGWQWDVYRGPALMGIEAPQALGPDGKPIAGQVLWRYRPNVSGRDQLLTDRHNGQNFTHEPYPAADVHEPEAVLTLRDRLNDVPAVVPRDRWRFAREEHGGAVPDDAHVWLADGFVPGRIYDLVYRTRICPVAGVGLLAVRDTIAFLRYAGKAAGNPCAGRVDYTVGTGASQCGRFLRHLLFLGLNVDEQGRRAFDGVLAHVAGGRRGQFNQRYAQPSDQPTRSFGHQFPFADDDQIDPRTGRIDGLLGRQRARGGVPRIMYTNTATEYWRGDAALVHTSIADGNDVEPPAEVRAYLFAGTQHGPGMLPLTDTSPLFGTRGADPLNSTDYRPLQRAALVNLERWVTAGVEPPPSTIPRHSDGTIATPETVLAAFAGVPATAPDPAQLQRMHVLDLGPDAEQGVGRYPAVLGEAYPFLVPAVDADGNDIAGIRLPDIATPLATYTGWNTRHPEVGGAGDLLEYLGSTLVFPATSEEPARSSDPRRSIAERYRDRDAYLAQVRAAAERLAEQRYLLPEDIELLVRQADQRYDAFTRVAAPANAD